MLVEILLLVSLAGLLGESMVMWYLYKEANKYRHSLYLACKALEIAHYRFNIDGEALIKEAAQREREEHNGKRN